MIFDSPLLLEVIEQQSKLEKILPEIKEIVGDDGLITLNETGVL